MTRRALITLAIALGVTALSGSSALAATLVGGGTLMYNAAAGEDNDLTVTLSAGTYTFTDPGVNITGISGCTGGAGVGTCPAAGVDHLEIRLSDMDDEADNQTATPATPILGGTGDDTLTGGGAGDRLEGEEDDDTLIGGAGDDELNGEELLSSTTGENDLDGGSGADTLTGGEGPDIVQGGSGSDRIVGLGDVDDLDGGGDTDDVSGGDGNDTMRGGDGDDRVGDDSLFVSAPSGFVPPERGDDVLEGGPGNDALRPGVGPSQGISDNDTLNGGPGADSAVYEKRTARVEVRVDGAPNDGGAGESDNVTGDVERVVGGQAGDLLVGGPANDTLDGFRGADTIQGGGGSDTLDGGVDDAESDSLAGGDGGDLLRGNAGDDALQGDGGADNLDGGVGDDGMQGGGEADQMAGGPGLDNLAGGAGDDQLDGSAPVLLGTDGRDTLRGDEGNDSLQGGPDVDTLVGGRGSDDMRGGTGRDKADYAVADGAVNVSLDSRSNDGQSGERDNVRGDVEDVAGGGVEDTFTGSRAANRLDGGAGEDYVDGARGRDDLRGGSSIDVVRSRDSRTRDSVRCGRGKDFAIVGREDRVSRDCEAFDNGIRRIPRTGIAFLLSPRAGASAFGPPGMRRTVPLKERLRVPVRSQVDARKGSVGVVTARSRRASQSGLFSGGLFQVLQGRSRRAVTELRLAGGNFAACRRAAGAAGRAGAAPAQSRRIRRLRARARGRFRTRGRHSAATVRGTTFTVEDRCDGTLTRVQSGVVRVRDFRRRRTVTVRAGKSYLARARR